ncbi:C40 family peptidase [Leptolyngbya sp. FACHB-261]|uniref:C40 family peptidase n=1 Tax=Leptolyngbya sp. FACHB-261 TaxID=2692806 RepID=UPI0016888C35|nr:C40 family peptidase [Leptolyngbya sp. FACHB-261]MBD2101850.1 C40 family peptidase [Leptolyngbya sp. FACHB-261]
MQVVQYQALRALNVYDGPDLSRLATQMAAGRYFCYDSPDSSRFEPEQPESGQAQVVLARAEQPKERVSDQPENVQAKLIRLVEDNYPGWLDPQDETQVQPAANAYQPAELNLEQIQARLPQVIQFALQASAQANYYLWGGTVGPNYDCSGLMQAAFQSAGIWLPRDAYQQEAFVKPVALAELQPGDLVFFGPADYRATHVGLVLGEGRYLHSSGVDQGRNGIGVDHLSATVNDPVSLRYFAQFRGGGRVISSYCP